MEQNQVKVPKRTKEPTVSRVLAEAIGDIQMYRQSIAHFLSDAIRWPENLIEHCDNNDWNESVAFDLREALFKLGCVLATLSTWEEDAGLDHEQRLAIDRLLHGEEDVR